MRTNTFIALIYTSLCTFSFAQYGTLDNTFDFDGKAQFTLGGFSNLEASDVDFQSDGKIIVSLRGFDNVNFVTRSLIIRLSQDGSLDDSFGTLGYVDIDFDEFNNQDNQINAVSVLPDNSIVIAGFAKLGNDYDAVIAHLNAADGAFNANFNTDGKQTIHVSGGNGNNGANDLLVDAQGRYLLIGYATNNSGNIDMCAIRLDANGDPDLSFGSNNLGFERVDFGGSSEFAFSGDFLADGRIVMGGSIGSGPSENFALSMLSSNGVIDPSFNGTGFLNTDFEGNSDALKKIIVLEDSKIFGFGQATLAGNVSYDMAACRYLPNGTLDLSFSTDGKETWAFDINDTHESVNAALLQADGKIIMAGDIGDTQGNFDFGLMRIFQDGTPDITFGAGGRVLTDFGSVDLVYGLGMQPNDDRIVAVGSTDNANAAFARYTTGTLTGMEESAESVLLNVYPNPASTGIGVAYSDQNQPVQFELIDFTGRIVLHVAASDCVSAGNNTLFVHLPENLQNGTYQLKTQMEYSVNVKSLQIIH